MENVLLKITQNYCKAFKKYGVKRSGATDSIEIHSIGCAQNTASAIRDSMNQYSPGGIVNAIVDAEVSGKVIEILPDGNEIWADAGYGNKHSYAIEIAESDSMSYKANSAEYTITNSEKFLADLQRGYNTAVFYVAKKCAEYGFTPTDKLANGLHRVYSHQEANALGLASAHVDPAHIWKQIGKTMDDFRAEVVLVTGMSAQSAEPGKTYIVQAGSFSDSRNADKLADRIKAAGFDVIIKGEADQYKVQCGVFSIKTNTDALVERLKAAGFEAIIKTV